MKKIFWIFAIFICLLSITGIVAFISTPDPIPLLSIEEQQKLKSEKKFWNWQSPYGPLSTHYIEKGEGSRHLIFIHGFRSYSYTWKDLIDPLAGAGYHVWAIDLIGYGLSDKPENVPYDVDFFNKHIYSFMEANEIEKAHIVGNSMGGGLALSIASQHPEKVISLSLMNALGYPLDLPFYLLIGKHVSPIWKYLTNEKMIEYGLKKIVYNQDMITDEKVKAYCLPYHFTGSIAAALNTLQNFDNQKMAKMGLDYPTLNMPILIIWGDKDCLIPVSHYEKFLNDFPRAEKLLITNCGHLPQEESPQIVLEVMLPFLEKSTLKNRED